MGNDLYWKKTPKPVDENTHGLYKTTWYFLKDLLGYEDRNDLQGIELTKDNLLQLKASLCASDNIDEESDLSHDINELIEAIKKYDSITLIIQG